MGRLIVRSVCTLSAIPLFDRRRHHSSVPTEAVVAAARSGRPGRPNGRREAASPWTVASTVGTSVGVAVGTLVTGYQTSLGALALGGLITGVIVGTAQTLALPASARFRWIWLPVTAALWPLAWTVTTLAGIGVDEQFIIFGASGAFVYTVLTGLVLQLLLPRPAGRTAASTASARR